MDAAGGHATGFGLLAFAGRSGAAGSASAPRRQSSCRPAVGRRRAAYSDPVRTAVLFVLLLVGTAPASAALPKEGTLVPGRTLGGVHLGEAANDVRAALGSSYGVCRGCATTTWYFTYRPFDRHGLAVELRRGRVSGVYTVWKPSGWRAPRGLRLGATELDLQTLAGPLVPIVCSDYDARIRDTAEARTVYYVLRGRLWGFGLLHAHADPCR